MKLTEFKKPTTTWLQLSDSRNNSTNWGELMFSLSYLPTAERLTVVVVKARNLKIDRENGNSPSTDNKTTGLENVFVKVIKKFYSNPLKNIPREYINKKL